MTKYIDRYYLNGEEYGIKFGGGGWQPGANTIAYYPFNGDCNDYSGNNRDLTPTNITYSQLGSIQVADFGTSSSILNSNYSGLITGTQPFTYSIFMKVSAYTTGYTNGTMLAIAGSSYGQYDKSIEIWSDGKIKFAVYDGDTEMISTDFSAIIGDWYHIVGTYDGTKIKLYVNGTYIGEQNASGTWSGGYNLVLPKIYSTSVGPFEGSTSNFIIENVAWTQQEVTDYLAPLKSLYGIS